jgi:predicted amidohydrolase
VSGYAIGVMSRLRKAPLTLATAQSVITADIRANGVEIRRLMRAARDQAADIVHFPESAMSGCSKAHIKRWSDVPWPVLEAELEETAALAASLGIWVVLGSAHRLTIPHRPHNSLYVLSPSGTVATRYDKQWCSHTEINDWYTPGQGLGMFEVAGWRFGCAVCIEIQFPELFDAYRRADVDAILFSAYSDRPMFGIQAQGYAASHGYWISVAVPAQLSGCMSSRLIGPSGAIQALCDADVSTLTVNVLDEEAPEWNVALHHARPWRAKAREGEIYRRLHVVDPRSTDRSRF